MSLSTADQLTAIQQTQFFTDLRTKLRTIFGALLNEDFTVEGLIHTTVADVPVAVALLGQNNVHIKVGMNDTGEPLYEWSAPYIWVS
jgi:arginine/ornithine N-succinyltransferase beta subunit